MRILNDNKYFSPKNGFILFLNWKPIFFSKSVTWSSNELAREDKISTWDYGKNLRLVKMGWKSLAGVNGVYRWIKDGSPKLSISTEKMPAVKQKQLQSTNARMWKEYDRIRNLYHVR